MTTFAQVRQDLANVLDGITGWSVNRLGNSTTPSGYIGDELHEYTFKIARPAFDPRMVFGETKKAVTFEVTAYAPRATPEVSEAALDALCEPPGTAGSLIDRVQTSANWSVTVDYAQVVECGQVQVIEWPAGVEHLACTFKVEVVW